MQQSKLQCFSPEKHKINAAKMHFLIYTNFAANLHNHPPLTLITFAITHPVSLRQAAQTHGQNYTVQFSKAYASSSLPLPGKILISLSSPGLNGLHSHFSPFSSPSPCLIHTLHQPRCAPRASRCVQHSPLECNKNVVSHIPSPSVLSLFRICLLGSFVMATWKMQGAARWSLCVLSKPQLLSFFLLTRQLISQLHGFDVPHELFFPKTQAVGFLIDKPRLFVSKDEKATPSPWTVPREISFRAAKHCFELRCGVE